MIIWKIKIGGMSIFQAYFEADFAIKTSMHPLDALDTNLNCLLKMPEFHPGQKYFAPLVRSLKYSEV